MTGLAPFDEASTRSPRVCSQSLWIITVDTRYRIRVIQSPEVKGLHSAAGAVRCARVRNIFRFITQLPEGELLFVFLPFSNDSLFLFRVNT